MMDIEELDPARTVVVATGNMHKLVEIEDILSAVLPDVRLRSPRRTGRRFSRMRS